jgi:hypothetical protein
MLLTPTTQINVAVEADLDCSTTAESSDRLSFVPIAGRWLGTLTKTADCNRQDLTAFPMRMLAVPAVV